MRLISVIILLVGAYWFSNNYRNFFPGSVQVDIFEAAGSYEGSCADKSKCMVLYLAPWCPHCRDSIPAIKSLVKEVARYDAGILVIVGSDKPEKIRQTATSIPIPVIQDEDRIYSKMLNIQFFPQVVLIDGSGNIKRSGNFYSFRGWPPAQIAQYNAAEYLK